jgi:hypothetical protein
MINIVLKNKRLIKIYKYSLSIFKFLNKHLYILAIISFISKSRKSIYYKIISWSIKLIILINILVGTGFIIYFTDFVNPFDKTFSFYYDILKPYIDFIKRLWHDIININIEDF